MTILMRALPYLVAVIVVLAIMAGCYEFGVHVEHLARVAEVSDLNRKSADALAAANAARADAEQAARDTEAKRVADMAALDANYQKELSDAKTVSDRTIADLRAGALRVRDQYTCLNTARSVPAAAPAGASGAVADAAGASGLRQPAIQFLLGEAKRADQCAVQVKALQDVVKRDRDAQ